MSGPAEVVIERLLDRAVARAMADSPRAASILAHLQGKRLAIHTRGTSLRVVVESTGRTLKAFPTGEADATIVGAPLSLLALAGADAQAVIRRGDVRIEGDAEIAQQFRELGLLLRPDLEAGMGRVLGRSGAHLAMRGLRAALDWTRTAAWTSVRNLAEYLAHETGDLVSRPEAEHYLRGVEQLREQLDRIEARLQLAEQRTQVLTGEPPEPP
ncbi:MAG: SCP2 domain-containing protein [Steroidobacterales bacterium]